MLVDNGLSSFFEDSNGILNIVYHAHFDTSSIHPRKVYINEVAFEPTKNSNRLKLKIKSPRIEQQLIQDLKSDN